MSKILNIFKERLDLYISNNIKITLKRFEILESNIDDDKNLNIISIIYIISKEILLDFGQNGFIKIDKININKIKLKIKTYLNNQLDKYLLTQLEKVDYMLGMYKLFYSNCLLIINNYESLGYNSIPELLIINKFADYILMCGNSFEFESKFKLLMNHIAKNTIDIKNFNMDNKCVNDFVELFISKISKNKDIQSIFLLSKYNYDKKMFIMTLEKCFKLIQKNNPQLNLFMLFMFYNKIVNSLCNFYGRMVVSI